VLSTTALALERYQSYYNLHTVSSSFPIITFLLYTVFMDVMDIPIFSNVKCRYIMGKPSKMLNEDQCALMAHYLKVHQQSDGGWGTHIESPSTMFGTVLCYVSLRLLGANPNSSDMCRARSFIRNEGGAVMTSSWAKFWLCLLGCMDWEGHNSVPPEMWLLPNWFPFHPGRLWCHCRMVYLPMGYLYGARFVYKDAAKDPLIQELREELYCNV
jgi:squalene cyclase